MLQILPQIRGHWSAAGALHRTTDGVSVLLGLVVAAQNAAPIATEHAWIAGGAGLALFFVAAELTGLYHSWRDSSLGRQMTCTLLTWSYTLAGLLCLGFVSRVSDEYPRGSFILWALSTAALVCMTRFTIRGAMRDLRSRGYNLRRFAIVGVNDLGKQLAMNISRDPTLGLELAGFYDDRAKHRGVILPAEVGQHLGNIEELIDEARAGRVHRIYITFPMRAEDRIRRVLARLGDTTASVYIVPDFFVFEMLHARWTHVGGLPAVSVFEQPFWGVDGVVKRTMDLGLAAGALVALALPMAIIAAAVKYTSPGPVFFRQKRYGLDGREIRVWKFRSMRAMDNGPVVQQATKADPRVTRLGAFLRKTSLDELPQLFNVLDGSMSLVGPRPHASAHNEQYRALIQGYMLRHKVKPGITGLAQVSGWRGETDTLDKMVGRVECDHQYIRDWSIGLDIKILFRTIFVVLKRQNAY